MQRSLLLQHEKMGKSLKCLGYFNKAMKTKYEI